MKKLFKQELSTYCTLHWWNLGKKSLAFKGELKDLLEIQKINYSIRKTKIEGLYHFRFKNTYGIEYKVKSTQMDFTYHAKKFIQMELCRMDDKSTLFVQGTWRATVTVNH